MTDSPCPSPDRLLNNPHAEPPLPSDWEVRPTYPVQNVPYFLAPLWDAEFARASNEKKAAKLQKTKKTPEEAVAKELRDKLKRSRGAKGLLQDLEKEVRGFVEKWEAKERQLEQEGLIDPDSEDEEIVFVGRNGVMSDDRKKERDDEDLRKDMMVLESLVDDHGAAFGYVLKMVGLLHVRDANNLQRRYLVHNIATYYGLKTWSITTGNPPRREAYIGLKEDPKTRRPSLNKTELPRPLWGLV